MHKFLRILCLVFALWGPFCAHAILNEALVLAHHLYDRPAGDISYALRGRAQELIEKVAPLPVGAAKKNPLSTEQRDILEGFVNAYMAERSRIPFKKNLEGKSLPDNLKPFLMLKRDVALPDYHFYAINMHFFVEGKGASDAPIVFLSTLNNTYSAMLHVAPIPSMLQMDPHGRWESHEIMRAPDAEIPDHLKTQENLKKWEELEKKIQGLQTKLGSRPVSSTYPLKTVEGFDPIWRQTQRSTSSPTRGGRHKPWLLRHHQRATAFEEDEAPTLKIHKLLGFLTVHGPTYHALYGRLPQAWQRFLRWTDTHFLSHSLRVGGITHINEILEPLGTTYKALCAKYLPEDIRTYAHPLEKFGFNDIAPSGFTGIKILHHATPEACIAYIKRMKERNRTLLSRRTEQTRVPPRPSALKIDVACTHAADHDSLFASEGDLDDDLDESLRLPMTSRGHPPSTVGTPLPMDEAARAAPVTTLLLKAARRLAQDDRERRRTVPTTGERRPGRVLIAPGPLKRHNAYSGEPPYSFGLSQGLPAAPAATPPTEQPAPAVHLPRYPFLDKIE